MPWTPESVSAFAKIRKTLGDYQSPPQREEAVRLAIQHGIPLFQIETFLDWLELMEQAETPSAAPVIPYQPGSPSTPSSSPIPGSE
jgi:hypothetical protein